MVEFSMQQGFYFNAVITYLTINSYLVISALSQSETPSISVFKRFLAGRLGQLGLASKYCIYITSIFTEVKIIVLMYY